ncbi:hypothetical protein GCM10023191_017280 [Actinoallomurus oryzae]|uniref:NACHT domain-containing protein n=1 Tax=Actinoallomurus oryzae TaxID=502180 RepID=A0ABP8PIS2_9ACTN
MTIERLHAVLSAVAASGPGPPPSREPPVTAQELAEILWLAVRMGEPQVTTPVSEPSPPRARDAAPDPSLREPAPHEAGPPAAPAPQPPPVRHELHGPSADAGEGSGAAGVLVPTAPMLDHPLELQRALRPLKRRVPSKHAEVLDEEATAARIADRRRWMPVMTPAPERWLSLVLVVDTGPTMTLWRPLARELREMLIRLGAFRDLRVCWLKGAGVSSSPGAPPRDAATLTDPSGRQVVLVLSDCSGPHWWDGRAGRALRLWATAGPVAIVQPLTERLWRRTAAPTTPGQAAAARPCAPGTALRFTPYDGDPGVRPGAVPVPVLECTAPWLADWAHLVSGDGRARPAAVAYVGGRPGRGTEPVRREHALPMRDRVRRFQASASPEAVRLAAHVAVSFPALPVMRLIQHRILGGSQPGHLAEVLLSGLLRPAGGESYAFVSGAREALLATLPRSAAWHTADVLERISEEIERRAGRTAETFRAALRTADGTGDHAAADGPFALVSRDALRLLGPTATATGPASATVAAHEAEVTAEAPAVTGDRLPLPDPERSNAVLVILDRYRPGLPDPDDDARALRDVLIAPDLVGLSPDRCPVRKGLLAQRVHAVIAGAASAAADTLIVYVNGHILNLPDVGIVLIEPGSTRFAVQNGVRLEDIRRQVRGSAARNNLLIVDAVHESGTAPTLSSTLSWGADAPETNTYEIIGVRAPGEVSVARLLADAIRAGKPGGRPALTVGEVFGRVPENVTTISLERGGPFCLTRNAAVATVAPEAPRTTPEPEDAAPRLTRRQARRHRRFDEEYREYVLGSATYVDQRGLATIGSRSPRVQDVFVDTLPTKGPADPTATPRLSFADCVRSGRPAALTIVGSAGSGKTTLLKYAVLEVCRANTTRRIPVFLYLRDHVAEIVSDNGLPTLLRNAVGRLADRMPEGWLERHLGEGQCVVLLDGLDEVTDGRERDAVRTWIERQIAWYQGNQYIITSRPGNFSAPIAGSDMWLLEPFNGVQIAEFVHKWYRAGADGEPDISMAGEASEDLLRRLRTNPPLLRLATDPLHLMMIINVHRYRGALPGSSFALYREIVDVALRREEAKGIPSRVPPARMKDALGDLAFTMMTRRVRDLAANEIVAELPAEDQAVFLEQATSRAGLLCEVRPRFYGFAALSVQEYLAAMHLRNTDRGEMLIDVVSDPWWRETILCYAAEGRGDALVQACLNDGGDYALALARDIVDAAVEVAPELRERLYGPDR